MNFGTWDSAIRSLERHASGIREFVGYDNEETKVIEECVMLLKKEKEREINKFEHEMARRDHLATDYNDDMK